MKLEILIADTAELGERLAADLQAEGCRALEARGKFLLALSGGSIAPIFFPRLALVPLDWSRTEFFWVDERAVPPTDPESNFRLARVAWLEPAGVPAPRVHRMPAEDRDLQRAAENYADELVRAAGMRPRLDFALLGVGPDGHVASLFPGHPASSDNRRLVAVVEDSPKPPPRRLTLTLPVLASAERVVIVALGASKAEAIREALTPHSILPIASVVQRTRRPLLLVDRQAGNLISR